MSEPLKKVSFHNWAPVELHGKGDLQGIINTLVDALNAAIERINELESKLEGHKHVIGYDSETLTAEITQEPIKCDRCGGITKTVVGAGSGHIKWKVAAIAQLTQEKK